VPRSEPCVHLVSAHGSSKPSERFRSTELLGPCRCRLPGVDRASERVVRRAVRPVGGVLPGDRLAGGAVPLFPFARALWLAVGAQGQAAHIGQRYLL
jgi:hypothetical protein